MPSTHTETVAKAEAADAGEAPETPRRTAVRRRFLDRLDEAGMTRPRALAAEAFGRMRERLVDHLAYLDDAGLDALAETVIGLGGGKARTEWPAEATIRNFAQAWRPAPPRDDRIVASWLRSPKGAEARDGGWLVELYRWLGQSRIPPNDYVTGRLRDEAEENRRRRAVARAEAAAGTAGPGELDWLSAYAAAESDALEIVHRGEAARRETAGAA